MGVTAITKVVTAITDGVTTIRTLDGIGEMNLLSTYAALHKVEKKNQKE